MPSTPEYSLSLNIMAWVLQLPTCLYFLFDTAMKLPLAKEIVIHGNRLVGLMLGFCIIWTMFFTLSTITSVIAEIVKIARRRMLLAVYLDYASRKTGLYAIYLLVGIILGFRMLIIVGGIVSVTSFIQVLHGVSIGTKMRKEGIAMNDEYELILDPTNAGRLEEGHDEPELSTKLSTRSGDDSYAHSSPPVESQHYKV